MESSNTVSVFLVLFFLFLLALIVLDILFALARGRALEGNNPFVQLGVMALVFCLALLYYKRKYSV